MNSPKLAFACIPFALLALGSAHDLAPRASDAVVIAVDAYGRPVPGLELEVVLRGKDGALTRKKVATSSENGAARIDVGRAALADVAVLGNHDVAAQTTWMQGTTRHLLFTVVPLVPFEARFVQRDGSAQRDVAVIFELASLRGRAPLAADGEDVRARVALSDDEGVVRGTAARGSDSIRIVVPGAMPTYCESAVPVQGWGAPGDVAVPLHASTHRFQLFVPELRPRPLTWYGVDREPDANVRWCGYDAQLVALPRYLERFAQVPDEDGLAPLLETFSLDEPDRSFSEPLLAWRGDERYVFSSPPVPEEGFDIVLDVPPAGSAAPQPPKDMRWTFVSHGQLDVRRRVEPGETLRLDDGMNSLWAAPIGEHDLDRVVRIDTSIGGPIEGAVEYEVSDVQVDISALPPGRWALESTRVLVNEDAAYVDVNEWAPLDADGRARTLAGFAAAGSSLATHGPGLASPTLFFDDDAEGRPVIARAPSERIQLEFVRPDGSPAAYVCFVASTDSEDAFFGGTETEVGWSDEKGRAVAFVDRPEGFHFDVEIATEAELVGTRFRFEGELPQPLRIVVPERGVLEVNAIAIAGGDPRPMLVQFGEYVEGDTSDVWERALYSRDFLTDTNGVLRIEGVPVGTYAFQITETRIFSPAIEGVHSVVVPAPE